MQRFPTTMLRKFPTPEAIVLDNFRPKTSGYPCFDLASPEVFQRMAHFHSFKHTQ
jgi:hypothetical protein